MVLKWGKITTGEVFLTVWENFEYLYPFFVGENFKAACHVMSVTMATVKLHRKNLHGQYPVKKQNVILSFDVFSSIQKQNQKQIATWHMPFYLRLVPLPVFAYFSPLIRVVHIMPV